MSNRPIPKIGAAVLLLGGCYSSRPYEGDGGAGALIAKSYCEQLDACDSSYVDDGFGGLAGCIDEVAESMEYGAAGEAVDNGAACGDALLEYYECWVAAIDGCRARTSEEDPFFEYDYVELDACGEAAIEACPVFEAG